MCINVSRHANLFANMPLIGLNSENSNKNSTVQKSTSLSLSKLLIITIITRSFVFVSCAVLSGPGREGGSGQSQGFPGEQHLLCRWPLHHGPVCLRLGSATQPLRPAGPAPPQPHGHHTRYCHTHHCEQHQQVTGVSFTGGSFIQSSVTWTTDVLPGDRQRPDVEWKCSATTRLVHHKKRSLRI